MNLSGFGSRDGGGGFSVLHAHAQVISLQPALHPGAGSQEAPGAKLRGRGGEYTVTIFSTRISQDQAGYGRAVTLLGGRAQFTDPTKIGSGAHHSARELHGIQLKVAGRQQLGHRAALKIV